MTEEVAYRYDVFISHSQIDEAWVDEWLQPRLEQAGLRVATAADLVVGTIEIEGIEQLVENSRHTVAVLTPAWLKSDGYAFVYKMARTLDPAVLRRKLLPVLLKSGDDDLPKQIERLVKVDLRNKRRWEKELKRLTRDILNETPPPPRADPGLNNLQWLNRWLRYYRRELRRGTIAIGAVWLIASLIGQWIPFQPRQVWVSLGLKADQATQLTQTGDVLLVGGNNIHRRCDTLERGLWRSPDRGKHWETVHAPLEFQDPERGCLLADITGFAVSVALPQRVYAATSHAGLLRSDDTGQTWQQAGGKGLPSPHVIAVAADPTDSERVFVALQEGGLFRSDDGGSQWQRLDQQTEEVACKQGDPLIGTLAASTLLATPNDLIAGTVDPFYFTEAHVPGGVYRSPDGGLCWQQIDDSRGLDEYRALTYAATATTEYILFLSRDWGKEPEENPLGVWRLDLAASSPKRELLWPHRRTVKALTTTGETWRIATPLGKVVQGNLDTPAHTLELPYMFSCFLLTCDVALISEANQGPPLLLADGRVFRLEEGAWWRRWWP